MQQRSAVPDPNAQRLMEGMLAAVIERGYASSTIADVVAHARVSKRTFYEHFSDKDACFLAAYSAASDETLEVIARAAVGASSWDQRVLACVRAYLRLLEEKRALTRVFLLEIHSAGPAALKMRRAIHDQFAALLRSLVDAARADGARLEELSVPMSIALVGGMHELVLVALERKQKLEPLADSAAELVRAVVRAP